MTIATMELGNEPRPASLRVLVADDHALVREGFRALLERKGYEVSGEAVNGLEAVS